MGTVLDKLKQTGATLAAHWKEKRPANSYTVTTLVEGDILTAGFYEIESASAAYQFSAMGGSSVGRVVTVLLGMNGGAVGLLVGRSHPVRRHSDFGYCQR